MTTESTSMSSAGDHADGATITNPILPGFHPDPSILRVGEDYYLATSTFQWYPGVTLHHSRDLVHWQSLGGALDELRLLDLSGVPDSGGIWAPCLSYAHGLFHLVFTRVDNYLGGWWDAQNYITTATDINGPWSDPVPAHARGFDASLHHDADGTCWFLSVNGDWRPGRDFFGGIQAQQWDCADGKLVGDVHLIYSGTEIGVTEGPHIYQRDGWYYLMTAEGGTVWDHQVTVARSRSLLGPYETDPAGPTLTSRNNPELPLQKAGHGSLVETTGGEWYLTHLVGRPHATRGRCIMGRETAIQKVTWTGDGWPRVAGAVPQLTVPAPALPAVPFPQEPQRDDFAGPRLGPRWATLRRPAGDDWIDLTQPGRLRIRGGQSPRGKRTPSLVARRVSDRHCSLETTVSFTPRSERQFAGVTAYYDTLNWHYAYITGDGESRTLHVETCDDGRRIDHTSAVTDLPADGEVHLRVTVDDTQVRFGYALAVDDWRELKAVCDATILSDEYAGENPLEGRPAGPAFTGAFLGLWVHDLGADGGYADFHHATYRAH